MGNEITITTKLTDDEVVKLFVDSFDNNQAELFNQIGKKFKEANFSAELQCCTIAEKINKDGKDFIFTLANFIKASGVSTTSKHQDHLINAYPCDGLY